MTMDGSILATRNFFPQTILVPMQKIRMFPTRDKLAKAWGSAIMIGSMNRAKIVMEPWNNAMGMAEKIQPLPMEAVMTMMMIASKIAFNISVE